MIDEKYRDLICVFDKCSFKKYSRFICPRPPRGEEDDESINLFITELYLRSYLRDTTDPVAFYTGIKYLQHGVKGIKAYIKRCEIVCMLEELAK
jgi:hypothetical protein